MTFEDADRDLAEDALRELVAEIAADDYRAKIGSPLTNNTAYLKAVALLEMRGVGGVLPDNPRRRSARPASAWARTARPSS
jgi:hypothetical protein